MDHLASLARPASNPAPLVTAAVVSPVAEDYLKVVWGAQEWSDEPVTTKWLAERLGVVASTVSETVRRLTAQGLLEHARYGAITLTDEGRIHAVRMVRRHRIIETYLVHQLGYTWDEVHEEADVLEHAVSDRMIERMDSHLGHPHRDPHGDPIPSADGTVTGSPAVNLADLDDGCEGVVARISDVNSSVLRYFADLGFGLDARVKVEQRREYAGVMHLTWQPAGDSEPPRDLDLGIVAAGTVWLLLA